MKWNPCTALTKCIQCEKYHIACASSSSLGLGVRGSGDGVGFVAYFECRHRRRHHDSQTRLTHGDEIPFEAYNTNPIRSRIQLYYTYVCGIAYIVVFTQHRNGVFCLHFFSFAFLWLYFCGCIQHAPVYYSSSEYSMRNERSKLLKKKSTFPFSAQRCRRSERKRRRS